MSRTLRVLPRAEAELAEAIEWYEARREGLGTELLELAREVFESLVSGLQGAFWELGGVPSVLRSDNLSAVTLTRQLP